MTQVDAPVNERARLTVGAKLSAREVGETRMEPRAYAIGGLEAAAGPTSTPGSMLDLGRDAVELGLRLDQAVFTTEIWNQVYQTIKEEFERTRVFMRLLPSIGPVSDVLTVPSDEVSFDDAKDRFTVNERETTGFTEPIVQLALTAKQVQSEEDLKTAVTLATRAANKLALAQDILIARGPASNEFELFKSGQVLLQDGAPEVGLVDPQVPAADQIPVDPVNQPGEPKRYGENAFAAVAEASTRLHSILSFPPPYAAVFPPFPYADAWAGPPATLIAAADRIKPLVTEGFYPSFALPVDKPDDPTSPSTGIVFAPHGNTMDVVVGVDPTMMFQQKDNVGLYLFRVFMRFALRIKERRAVVQLRFK